MRRWPGALVLLACAVSGCGASARAPAAATSIPRASEIPTTNPSPEPTTPPARTYPTEKPVPVPHTLYSLEQVGTGEYQLTNNLTEQFVQGTARGVRTVCPGGFRTTCTDYVKIAVTEYSGNTQVTVSQSQFALATTAGVRYTPAAARQATRVVQPNDLLPATVLQPDDDTDFASGTLVFPVPEGPGRFSLLWEGRHLATFVKTAKGKLYETR